MLISKYEKGSGGKQGARKVKGAGLIKKDIHLIKDGVSKGYVKPEGDLIIDKIKLRE